MLIQFNKSFYVSSSSLCILLFDTWSLWSFLCLLLQLLKIISVWWNFKSEQCGEKGFCWITGQENWPWLNSKNWLCIGSIDSIWNTLSIQVSLNMRSCNYIVSSVTLEWTPWNPSAFHVIVPIKYLKSWKPPLIHFNFCFLQDLVEYTFCPVQRTDPWIQLHVRFTTVHWRLDITFS